jgi:hypothetical protein
MEKVILNRFPIVRFSSRTRHGRLLVVYYTSSHYEDPLQSGQRNDEPGGPADVDKIRKIGMSYLVLGRIYDEGKQSETDVRNHDKFSTTM